MRMKIYKDCQIGIIEQGINNKYSKQKIKISKKTMYLKLSFSQNCNLTALFAETQKHRVQTFGVWDRKHVTTQM